jgi:hypothetical protein
MEELVRLYINIYPNLKLTHLVIKVITREFMSRIKREAFLKSIIDQVKSKYGTVLNENKMVNSIKKLLLL